jgi:predicted Zn-dependent protease
VSGLDALLDPVRRELHSRSASRWEIFAKRAVSREIRSSPRLREESERTEEGFAARWQEGAFSRFASGSSVSLLLGGIGEAGRLPSGSPEPLPDLPSGRFIAGSEPAGGAAIDPFEPLSQLLASESKGHVRLTTLTSTRGFVTERLENGAGFEGTRHRVFGYGNARAVGARDGRRMSADAVFPLSADAEPDLAKIAQTLSDRCLIPLRGSASPFPRGELLLDPSVSALVLSATMPLFCGDEYRLVVSRRYLDRSGRFCAAGVSIVDDATAEYPFDGEGVPVARHAVVEEGAFRLRLHDLASASRSGERPTGNSIRSTFRLPPRPGAARVFLQGRSATTPADLLAGVTRGIYATAVSAPMRVDLENDSYALEIEGWAIQAGRAKALVGSATIRGRLSDFWRSISGVGNDLRWSSLAAATGAPTLLLPRVVFS